MRHLRRCVNGARSIQHLCHNAIASRYNCDSNNVTQRERKDDSIAWSESTKQRQNSIVVGFKKIEAKTSLFSYYCAPVQDAGKMRNDRCHAGIRFATHLIWDFPSHAPQTARERVLGRASLFFSPTRWTALSNGPTNGQRKSKIFDRLQKRDFFLWLEHQ